MPKKRKTEPPKQPTFPIVIETFRRYGNWELAEFERWAQPSCFNGVVTFHKYRVTIEEIEEPK